MKNVTINFILARTSANYENIHKTGVYKIYHINKPDIFYVGSATSEKKWRSGFKQRWVCHIKELNNNNHHSPFFQRVVNKYGIEGLRFEIIEKCIPVKCLEREQYWLDFYKPFGRKGYNTCKIAGNSLGYRFPENKKAKRKPICQYSLEGNFIKRWDSLNQASRELNISVSSIKDCCKKRFKQIKGFIFRYEGELDLPEYDSIRVPMKIDCIFNGSIVCTGYLSEIRNLVPDKKQAIYKSIRSGNLTRNNYKYNKK